MTNRWLKMLSIFLSLVLIFNLLPLQVLAAGVDDALQPSLSVLPDDGSSGSAEIYERLDTLTIVEEDTSRRGEYYKEFVLNNGLRLAAVYNDPVHYADGAEWKDIDNTLKAVSVKGVAGYTNTAGVWQVYFPQQLSGSNAISLTKDGYTVSFGMAGELTNNGGVAVASIGTTTDTMAVSSVRSSAAQIRTVDLTAQKAAAQYEQTVLEKHSSKLAYASVYNNTEIVYDLSGNRLKESVVISKYNASLWGYRYNLNTGGLTPVLSEDNTIELRHPETAEVVMTMPAPFMVDANGEYNYDVDVSLVQKNGSYLLSYYVPRTWLASADRAWPVVLDPVVEAGNVRSNIQDITVSENTVYSNNAEDIRVGYGSTAGILRSYLRYKSLPSLTSSSVIINATLTMTKLTSSSVGAQIEVRKVEAYWQPSGMTWDTKPAFDAKVEDVIFVKDPQTYTWDITNIALDWYSTELHSLTNNTGLMFKATESVESAQENNWQRLCSSDGTAIPQLQITYMDTAGLEDYWDYSEVSAGRAGTGYVHNHSGNLVWVHNDMGFDGNVMPVSINHIYNPSLTLSNDYGLGYGWQTNYHQLIRQESESCYIWTDGDGTLHYFYSTGTGTFQDEDNLHLTLIVSGNQITISDEYGNKSVFEKITVGTDQYNWRLIKQIANQPIATESANPQYGFIQISYLGAAAAQNRKISTIRDGVGRIYQFTYGDDGLLDAISYPTFDETGAYTVLFDHNANAQLKKITYADGGVTTFVHADSRNVLSSVTNVDGYKIAFSYGTTGTGKPHRVTKIKESHNSEPGAETTFEYGVCSTKITTPDENTQEDLTQVFFFDQWGNTLSVQDQDGRAIVSQYEKVAEPGDPTHLMTASSSQQITVNNLLSNSSFENKPDWQDVGNSALETVDERAFLGGKSLKFSAAENNAIMKTGFIAEPGESYTFSAYIYSTNTSKVCLAIVPSGASPEVSQPATNSDNWTRLAVTYSNDSQSDVSFSLKIYSVSACYVYVDCVQLEKSKDANRYNLLQNTDFTDMTGWSTTSNTGTSIVSTGSAAAEQLDSKGLKVVGTLDQNRVIAQNVPINQTDRSFVISGWAKGISLPTDHISSRSFAIRATMYLSNGLSNSVVLPFNISNTDNWQYVAGEIGASWTCESITVELLFNENVGTVYFDGIGLYMESLGEKYSYNSNGNITVVTDELNNITRYLYAPNGVDVKDVVYPTGIKMSYTYDPVTHNVLTEEEHGYTNSGYVLKNTTTYAYDDYGNVTGTSCVTGGENPTTQTTSAFYTFDGNYLSEYRDEAGKTTRYSYDSNTGLLDWVQYPEDTEATRTQYTYDDMLRAATISTTTDKGVTMSVQYGYTKDNLTTIATPNTVYSLTYGAFGTRTMVKAGNYTLASYEYTDLQKRYLASLAYGTGDVVEYTYDKEGRTTQELYTNDDGTERIVTYTYNARGLLATKHDSVTEMTTKYLYDAHGRLIHFYDSSDNATSKRIVYERDNLGNITKATEKIGGRTDKTEYWYDEQNRVTGIQDSSTTVGYTYDNLNRLVNRSARLYNQSSGAYGTAIISSITYDEDNDRIHTLAVGGTTTYTYDYDDNGNIISVTTGNYTTYYEYDSQNQLVWEKNGSRAAAWEWTYDASGNILSRKQYAYSNGTLGALEQTVSYQYNDSSWGDLLTSYNGRSFTYDEIGNPLSDGTWNYTWKQGRQLTRISRVDNSVSWDYTYNDEGLRVSKTNGFLTYNYIYADGQLRAMTVQRGSGDTYDFVFRYGADGRPYSVRFEDTDYFYLLNAQGDVIGIVDGSGASAAIYSYDAWGNVLTAYGNNDNATLAQFNPLRYRSYVYDHETGLYYLKTRYYNPELGRFISPDNYPTTGQGLTGNNMFVYCGNNPVMRADDSGQFWHIIVGAAIGAVANGVIKIVGNLLDDDPNTDWNDGLGLAMVTGAVTGGLTASGCGPAVQMAVNAAATAIEDLPDVVEDIKNGEDVLTTLGGYAFDVGLSAVTSYGPGLGSKAATNLGKQTVKRTWNAFKHDGLRASISEAGKAAKWYWKSAKTTIGRNSWEQTKGFLNDIADTAIQSWIG